MDKIIICQYDPQWGSQFETLYNAIWPHISDVALSLEHVGSTSVPGLSAKPIIDMTIVVATPNEIETVIHRLNLLGITHRGDLGIAGREAFSRLTGYAAHNLYACVTGSQALRNHLIVRDTLRNDPALAQEYGELKRSLASKYRNDIDSYVEEKTSFLLGILERFGFTKDELRNVKNINRKK